MAKPVLTPTSATSSITLPVTGSPGNVSATLPYGIYSSNADFLSGAADQVSYVYKKLGGDVLDIEITEGNVYSAYEESVLEYSYIVNIHQAKNSLSDLLGAKTGSFDQDGQIKSGEDLSGSNVQLKYPQVQFSYVKKVGYGVSNEINLNGFENVYSASFDTVVNQQDYDLQNIVSSSAALTSSLDFFGKVGNNRIAIKKVYYKTPHAMWRFYGYYGGLNTVGNLQNYGQWADDSQFQIVPVWQNKLQAKSFESAIYTRNSHYAYEIKNNKIRLFPEVVRSHPAKIWIEFAIPNEKQPWEEYSDKIDNVDGVNNMNTLPFENIRYESINSIGKQWIRRFALALSKEMLGQVRGKFANIPIPGESISLNASDLLSQAKQEQDLLREELKKVLDELTYAKLLEQDAADLDNTQKVQQKIPYTIFVG